MQDALSECACSLFLQQKKQFAINTAASSFKLTPFTQFQRALAQCQYACRLKLDDCVTL